MDLSTEKTYIHINFGLCWFRKKIEGMNVFKAIKQLTLHIPDEELNNQIKPYSKPDYKKFKRKLIANENENKKETVDLLF